MTTRRRSRAACDTESCRSHHPTASGSVARVGTPQETDVLILTGPPGAGKSSAAAVLAQRAERAVHLESDVFFRFVVSGFVEPWRPESQAQNEVVMGIVAEAAAGYARGGYFTIVDGIVIPRWFLGTLREAFGAAGLASAYAVLRPPVQVCVKRVDEREGGPLADPEVISQLWSQFAGLGELERNVVAVDGLDPEGAADAVEQALAEGALAL
jgi:tRNA uridine 5-carbamoylmethylation protein Kti12